MSLSRILAGLVCACVAGFGIAQDAFPFKVRVGQNGAMVRSGPGDGSYATDELRAGEEVEVWQRGPGGWLAVRPPKSSFSLVDCRGVERIPKTDLGEVCGEDVVAWVASSLGHTGDYGWQVQLDPGEKVIVLGEERRRLPGESAAEAVYRIMPPAGEFRWVHESDLGDRTLPGRRRDSAVRRAEYQVEVGAAAPGGKPQARRDDFVARKKASVATKPNDPVRTEPAAKSVSQESSSLSTTSDKALRDLELRLSLMAAQPPKAWDFAALRDEAQSLADRGATTLERARAQRLLEQVEEFVALQERFSLLERPGQRANDGETSGAASPTTPRGPSVDPRFDGTGWLLPVHSSQRLAPPYALLDAEGRILQFVSPAPGLNLHRYLRKEIGVYGQRSFVPSLDKPHITAQRVVEIDRHRR